MEKDKDLISSSNSEWDESKHNRDEMGRFAEMSQKAVLQEDDTPKFGSQEELDEFLGEEFKGYKGQAAIDKLLQEKRGHIKAAFHRDDIGDIDLVWGNDYVGLQHIIKQREKQGIDTKEFMRDLTQVIENGDFYNKNERGNFEFLHNGKMAVIAPEYHENKIVFVLTAYKTRKKAPSDTGA